MRAHDKVYIDGQWVDAHGDGNIDVIHSTTEEVIGRIPVCNEADVDDAVKAARKAFPSWSALPVTERAAWLGKISEGLMGRADEIGKLISEEVGMPLKLSTMIQGYGPAQIFASFAKVVSEFTFEEEIGSSLVLREAVGVVGCITPWNYPLWQIAVKVAPALAAGCTVVVKPSEVAPLNAYILCEVLEKIGLPAGVFNMVTGTGVPVGEAIASHPDVDMVSFTGSTRAGRRVAELASQHIKRVALELGGKSASIILDDADFAAAIKGSVSNCYMNSGQTCSAWTRMLVPAAKHDEAVAIAKEVAEKFTVGDPVEGKVKLGPLVSAVQQQRVRDYIRHGIEEGATLVTGGPEQPEGLDKGFFVRPTVFANVKNDMKIAQEEIFGPVLCIIPYEDEDDAISIANDSPYGLGGGVWSASDERAKKVARRMRTGQVGINGGQNNMFAPFGGYKQSGYGREFGKYGLEEYLEVKSLQL